MLSTTISRTKSHLYDVTDRGMFEFDQEFSSIMKQQEKQAIQAESARALSKVILKIIVVKRLQCNLGIVRPKMHQFLSLSNLILLRGMAPICYAYLLLNLMFFVQ